MRIRISSTLLLVYLAMPSCATVQVQTLWQELALSGFNVTDGTIKKDSGGRLVVESSEMRAVLISGIHRAARADFTYAGRTSAVSKLADGEVRSQFGLKLRAHDPCNLVYVMWWFEPQQKIAVSVKYNPGMASSNQCGDRGYLKLDYPRERFEILAQDDCSVDDSYAWMLRAQEDFKEVRIRLNRNHKNSGKAKTICNALPQSQAEIIMSIARTASSTQSAFAN